MTKELKLPAGTPMLDMDSPTFASDFAAIVGPGPIEIVTPQFTRTDGLPISAPNLTPDEWQNLGKLPLERLRQMGFQMWDEDEKGIHWLFPGEWFHHIPEGLEVVSISGKTRLFNKHTEDDDIRFGALSFGFITSR